MPKSERWFRKHGGKISDKNKKKRASKWIGKRSTTVSGSKMHRKLTWI